MSIRKLSSDFVSFLKNYKYSISFEKVQKDYSISKTVFYSILKEDTYKNIIPQENLVFFDKYKKYKKEFFVEKNKIYKRGKNSHR